MFIGVIGGGDCTKQVSELAEEVGRELATRDCTVVCGGLGGVMEAVCRGAKARGGRTIGVLPGHDRAEANPYVDIPIVTGMRYARNVIVVKSSEAVIAIDGSFGTLSEVAHALADHIPVIGLRTWAFSLDGDRDESITIASNPLDAVEKAIVAAKARR